MALAYEMLRIQLNSRYGNGIWGNGIENGVSPRMACDTAVKKVLHPGCVHYGESQLYRLRTRAAAGWQPMALQLTRGLCQNEFLQRISCVLGQRRSGGQQGSNR